MPGKGCAAQTASTWHDPGLPAIDRTLDDLLRENAMRAPGKAALVFYGAVKTYGELDREVSALAAYLQKACAVAKGDRVGLMMQNAPQFVVGTYAIIRAGGIVVPINVMNQAGELEFLVGHAGMDTVLVAEDMVARFSPLLDRGVLRQLVVARYADETDPGLAVPLPPFISARGMELPAGAVPWSQALSSGASLDPVAIAPSDLCLMPYTAGSTGQPKGCMHTHVSVLSAVRCMTDWFHFGPDDVFLAAAPMFHVVGLQAGMNAAMAVGGTSVILPRWDRDVAATLIRDFRVTAWPTVPTAVIDFLARPDFDRHDLASLRVLWGGGSAMPEAVAKKLFDLTGLRFVEGYGMTETMAPATTNPPDRPKDQCAGLPALGTLIRLIDPETHMPTPAGEVGEVVISGPQVMQGYWQNPEATTEAFVILDGHRFLRSGDLGRLDDAGYLYIVDRLKRMINASGFKVWPSEVETTLYAHPAIHDVCVITARDPYRGETVKAVVVLKPGASLTIDALQDWARDHMAAYKIPRMIEIVDALPKSGAGKVLWRDLQRREDARWANQPAPAHR